MATQTITTKTTAGTRELAKWPVGDAVIIDRGALDKGATPVPVGRYVELGRITLPAGGCFDVSAAIRLPAGCWARWRWVRIGWGADPDGRDETGAQPLPLPPDGEPCSHTPKGHSLSGGGPLACEIKVYAPAGQTVTTLPVVKLMARRLH